MGREGILVAALAVWTLGACGRTVDSSAQRTVDESTDSGAPAADAAKPALLRIGTPLTDASPVVNLPPQFLSLSRYTIDAPGHVVGFEVVAEAAPEPTRMVFALYDEDAHEPSVLQSMSSVTEIPALAGTYTLQLSAPLAVDGGTAYWAGVTTDLSRSVRMSEGPATYYYAAAVWSDGRPGLPPDRSGLIAGSSYGSAGSLLERAE